jgi:hypothetical protein
MQSCGTSMRVDPRLYVQYTIQSCSRRTICHPWHVRGKLIIVEQCSYSYNASVLKKPPQIAFNLGPRTHPALVVRTRDESTRNNYLRLQMDPEVP